MVAGAEPAAGAATLRTRAGAGSSGLTSRIAAFISLRISRRAALPCATMTCATVGAGMEALCAWAWAAGVSSDSARVAATRAPLIFKFVMTAPPLPSCAGYGSRPVPVRDRSQLVDLIDSEPAASGAC